MHGIWYHGGMYSLIPRCFRRQAHAAVHEHLNEDLEIEPVVAGHFDAECRRGTRTEKRLSGTSYNKGYHTMSIRGANTSVTRGTISNL